MDNNPYAAPQSDSGVSPSQGVRSLWHCLQDRLALALSSVLAWTAISIFLYSFGYEMTTQVFGFVFLAMLVAMIHRKYSRR